MLSYRHGFHAGNFADVHKHIVLTLLVESLLHKDKAFCYLDTHSGSGLYDLDALYSQKNREYAEGIGRLWARNDLPAGTDVFMQAVRAQNTNTNALRYYPGSPLFVHHLLRAQDRMVLNELHSTEAPLLEKCFAGDRQVKVYHQDGYQALKACLPPQERRGLVLIDPAYELHDEYKKVIEGLKLAHGRWSTGIIALWFPVDNRKEIEKFYRRIRDTGIKNILLSEIMVRDDTRHKRLNGSGMIVINPPWKLEEQLKQLSPWLSDVLAQETSEWRVEMLVPE